MFKAHPELPGIIVQWFVTTLIKTPGHAPADGLADANSNLADAYLAGQKDLARRYAEKALALLDSHKTPPSSWSDTEPRRDEIRHSAMQTLAQAIK